MKGLPSMAQCVEHVLGPAGVASIQVAELQIGLRRTSRLGAATVLGKPFTFHLSPFTVPYPPRLELRLGDVVKCGCRLTLDGTEVRRPPIVVGAGFLVTGARTD